MAGTMGEGRGLFPFHSLGSVILGGSGLLLTNVCLCGVFLHSNAILRNSYRAFVIKTKMGERE